MLFIPRIMMLWVKAILEADLMNWLVYYGEVSRDGEKGEGGGGITNELTPMSQAGVEMRGKG